MSRLLPYGISNFRKLLENNYYYIDKTHYIEKLERYQTPIFLRPRRFGKSLFTEMLRWYYDIKAKDQFEKLFGNLYIGKNPTIHRNNYFFLGLDFSGMSSYSANDKDYARKGFNRQILIKLSSFLRYYKEELHIDKDYITRFEDKYQDDAAAGLMAIVNLVEDNDGKTYLTIDEYDSLTNAMAIYYIEAPEEKNEYLNITKKGGFFRMFFETIKQCTKSSLDKVFITGILPITISDMNSGFNIVEWITHKKEFVNMLGITENEMNTLLQNIYNDYKTISFPMNEVKRYLKQYYNGYKFDSTTESIYNPMMSFYFLDSIMYENSLPNILADQNIRVQYNQVAYIFGKNKTKRDEVLAEITDRKALSFSVSPGRLFDLRDYKSGTYINECLYYLGLLTYGRHPKEFVVPNIITYEMILSYFERIKDFEIEKRDFDKYVIYYMHDGNLENLVKAFFEEIIQKFPGDFFKDVNESFYRGLFYHALCIVLPPDMYEVLPEFNLAAGTVDIMVKSLSHPSMEAPVKELIEIKRVPKLATDAELNTKFNEARKQVAGYATGEYKGYRTTAICFRGNKDYLIEISE